MVSRWFPVKPTPKRAKANIWRVRLGIRHIDTAEAYQNEAEIGASVWPTYPPHQGANLRQLKMSTLKKQTLTETFVCLEGATLHIEGQCQAISLCLEEIDLGKLPRGGSVLACWGVQVRYSHVYQDEFQ